MVDSEFVGDADRAISVVSSALDMDDLPSLRSGGGGFLTLAGGFFDLLL